MAVRTKQLCARRAGLNSGNQTLYTCPVGETCIVKSIQAFNRSGFAVNLRIGIDPVGAVAPTVILQENAIPTNGWRNYQPWWVLMPDDALVIASPDATNGVDAWFLLISGTELEGVAD